MSFCAFKSTPKSSAKWLPRKEITVKCLQSQAPEIPIQKSGEWDADWQQRPGNGQVLALAHLPLSENLNRHWKSSAAWGR